jgi:hypothetical protein
MGYGLPMQLAQTSYAAVRDPLHLQQEPWPQANVFFARHAGCVICGLMGTITAISEVDFSAESKRFLI